MQMFEHMAILSSYVQHFGVWAPAVAFILFVIQASLPVFPYIILAACGGMLFGFKAGILLAWSGALIGSCLCYWFCRLAGYNWFSQWLFAHYGYNTESYNPSTAFWSIVVSLMIPFVPTPLVNAAAALSGVSFPSFFFAMAIGKIPTAVLYTGLGLALFNAKDVNTILLIIAAVIILLLGIKLLLRKFSAPIKIPVEQNNPDIPDFLSEPEDTKQAI
jgi:uncharacterized membrane protein YdjX (TVP38/TMEM64 family)